MLDLRRAVLAADRAADPRPRRVRRAAAARHRHRGDPDPAPAGLILSEARPSVYEEGAPAAPRAARARPPGAGHLLRDAGDGPVARRARRGRGRGRVRPHPAHGALGAMLVELPSDQQCWMSHRDTVFEPPPGFTALASSPGSPVAACEEAPIEACTGSSSTPRLYTPPTGPTSERWFLATSPIISSGGRRPR